MSAPDKIYLQWGVDEDFDVTWCVDQIDETDVEYCRITAEELSALRRVAEASIEYLDASANKPDGDILTLGLKVINAIEEYRKCHAA